MAKISNLLLRKSNNRSNAPTAHHPQQLDAPLTLSNNELPCGTLVAIQRAHQPRSTARTVRQANTLSNVMATSKTAAVNKESTKVSVRDALLECLQVLVPTALPSSHRTTTGVNQQVRHAGVYVTGSTSKGGAREAQKVAALDAAASVSALFKPQHNEQLILFIH